MASSVPDDFTDADSSAHTMQLTLRQLRYFSRIIEAGTITGAAHRLHLAPTALSLQVKAMEDRLGVKLLHRHSRGVRPTASGELLYDRGLKILAMVQETERAVSRSPSARQPVELGLPPSMVRLLGIDVVHAAAEQSPSLDLRLSEVSTRSQLAQLETGELQFGLARGLSPTAGLRQLAMIEERLVFVTAPQAARPDRILNLREALSGNLAFYREGDSVWRAVHATAQAAGETVKAARVVGSVFGLRELVTQGRTAAILPFGLVERDAKSDMLVVHEIVDQPVRQWISLAWLAGEEQNLPIGDVIEFVKGLAGELGRRSGQYMLVPQAG